MVPLTASSAKADYAIICLEEKQHLKSDLSEVFLLCSTVET